MNKIIPFLLGCFCTVVTTFAQNTSDIVVPITVTTTANPPAIKLDFPATANAVSTLVGRKLINQTSWSFIVLPANATTFTDSGVLPGIGFEYIVIKQTSVAPTTRVGLVYAGIEVPAPTTRGKMILVVDDQLSAPLATELERLEWDLRGDGWQVVRRDIDVASSSVPSVKTLLRDLYDQDPDNTVTALLFGNIPVAYSGNINPDAHPDHLGAWPTDLYYGDMDEQFWTDSIVNNTIATRPANHNVPGDGKFDRSTLTLQAFPEIIVSRVDFSNLSGWSVSQTELYRRYLDKNHNFRTGAYKPDNQTLVDDNFGFFGGEAFAQNGWRNGYALTGTNSIVQGDFFNNTDNQSFLIGYGCGGGNYQGASGVGTSANFQADSVNVVFSMLFGSYFGDWDFETNPFMPSALASKGGILTCTWAGRPNWHYHHMGLGEPIWVSTLWVWINSVLPNPVYPPNAFDDQIHVGMLGDPSLRAHNMRPPEDIAAMASCDDITLNWKASPDADLGYVVYRAASPDSAFLPLVTNTIPGTSFVDTMPLAGTNYYMVKAFRLEMTPTGSYYNQSIGTPVSVDFNTNPPTAVAIPSDVSCFGEADGSIELNVSGGTAGYTYAWSNGETTQNLNGLNAGAYTVTVTDNVGCTATTSATVNEPPALDLTTSVINVLCSGEMNGQVELTVSGGTPGYSFEWSNGATTQNLDNLPAGIYTVTTTDTNGCTETTSAVVTEPAPVSITMSVQDVSCNGLSDGNINAGPSGGTPGYTYLWSNGATTPALLNIPAGTYTLTISDSKGCTASNSATVNEPPAINASTDVTNAGCAGATNGAVDLTVSGGVPGYTFAWSNGSTDEDLTDVAAGTYTVTITDNASCTHTTSATVGQVTTLEAQATSTAAACFGQGDGTAEATASGGDPDYTYLWSTNETTALIENLAAGTYTVTVTDNAGCTATATAVVVQPVPFELSTVVTNISCSGVSDGSIDLTVSGGTPGYAFIWSTAATVEDISNLDVGTYTVTITDANGCTTTASTTVEGPPILTAEIGFTQTSCPDVMPTLGDVVPIVQGGTPGYTYLWSNGATTPTLENVPFDMYVVTVTDANGCTVEVTNMTVLFVLPWEVSATVDNVSCNGGSDGKIDLAVSGSFGPPYTLQWSTSPTTGLEAGTYTVTVTDSKGCSTSESYTITEPDAISLTDTVITSATCNLGGTITINAVSGGTPPFTYNWTGPAGFVSAEKDLTDLEEGLYQLTITDNAGCTETFEAEVPGPGEPPIVSVGGPDTACVNVPATYILSPDTGTNYQWNAGPNGTVLSGQGTAMVSVQWSVPGVQTLQVTYNWAPDCEDALVVSVYADICVGINEPKLAGVRIQPNPFTDRLTVLFERPVAAGAQLRLLDMQGRLVFEQTSLTETTRLETGSLPAGSYVLHVIENGQTGVWKVVKTD